jgi:hypothetical protein
MMNDMMSIMGLVGILILILVILNGTMMISSR